MILRRSIALRLLLLSAAAAPWLFGARPAQGGSTDDEGVPAGTVTFFTGGTCPPGWMPVGSLQGRLLVGAPTAAGVGQLVGVPLGDREDREHQHGYQGTVTLPDKAVAAIDGGNNNGAAAKMYTVQGTTALQITGLPFVQVQPCAKP